MANSATGSRRDLSNSKELLSTLSLSDTENDDDHKWRHSNESKPSVRRMDHNDPAILSYGGFNQRFGASQETVATHDATLAKKDRCDSPNLSSSEPDVRNILRYSRESLLTLRDSELSKRKPEQIGRAWIRIGVSNDDRDSRGGDGNENSSSYSSNTSLANTSSPSYLLPSFACKRRIPGTSQSSNVEIKRNSALTPKKEEPSSSSLTAGRRSISNSRNSNSNEDEDARSGERSMFMRRQNEYRNANESRRIGSGRIPLRDSWDDPKYSRPDAKDYPSKSSGDASSSPTHSATTTATSAAAATATAASSSATTSSTTITTTTLANKTEQNKASDTSSNDFNLRPGGGLLGLRDRQRENEQQSQSTIATQPHPHLPRTILGNNSILDKDSRSDFRERSVLGSSNDDRFDRNDRIDRIDKIDRIDRFDRIDRMDRIDRLDRNDRGDRRPFNRDRDRDRDRDRGDRDFGRYNDDVMPRNSMSRYNHGDRMNSYSQYNFKNNDDRGNHRGRHYRNAEEPEWFSGGPTSQNDTIELRGFEEYSSGRQDDSPASPTDDADDDKAAAVADYDGSDKANDECENVNDDNNNDNNEKSGKDAATNHRESNADNKSSNNDFDADDLEVMGTAAESKSNKKDDNFNFEDFLKVDNLTDLLAGGDAFNENCSGESRFSRWFRPNPDDSNPMNQMLPPEKGAAESINHNENGDKNMFAQLQSDTGNMGDASAAQNTFLEFLQRGKFTANMQKPPGPPHPQPPHPMMQHMMMENNNIQHEFQQQQLQLQQQQQHPQMAMPHAPVGMDQPMMGSHGPLSVEELEARLRQTGPATSNSSAMPNDAMKSSQQDMVAFKKLLEQIICEPQQSSSPQQQQHQSMFPVGSVAQPPLPQQQPQNQQSRQLIPHPEAVKKMLMSNVPASGPPHASALVRMEVLSRPETQVLIQRLNNGELSQGFLLQQLNNPNVNQRDREMLFTALGHFNATQSSAASENNKPHPVLPNNMPMPNANLPPNMQTPTNAALSPDMLRQLYLQAAVTNSKQQLRISPLPNGGIPQRIPSPRELQFHTQSIMQNALIKKKLEEQRENFRKRQEQQQQHINPNLAGNSNGMMENMHDGSMNNQQMNRVVSPNSSAAMKQLNQNQQQQQQQQQHQQHTSSPTPTLAFTPTSVLRKMTAEKDMDSSTNTINTANNANKDLNKQQQQQKFPSANVFRRQPNVHIHGMQGMPIQGMQAMQGIGMQGLPQNQFLPIQPNNSQQQQQQQLLAQQKGRPIVKGNGVSNQFAANEFQQAFMLGGNNNSNRPQFNLEQQRQQFQFQQAQQAQHAQQFHHMMQQHQQQQQMMGGPQMMMHNEMQQQQQQQQRSNGDGTLSPTSNQLARWFSPELLAQASAGKLPSLDATQALSLEEFERNMHSSTTVNN